ncbi:hypothetical protein Golomagni_07354 [Golovinomyces magnicellulatus]|nr:hypothetical protein Golomagni_07354 [Golovinomyces magnicellulatus]
MDRENERSPPFTKSMTHEDRMAYRIGRGEQGVLTFEPYKSHLLPLWRFRTPPIAKKSAQDLWKCFEEFYEQHDFIGMDMTRKFIQMGMTRAKRQELPKSTSHAGKNEKEQASQVFRKYWQRCKSHEGYQKLKEEFIQQQKS